MGTFTELILGVMLKEDTPDQVINSIKYMIGDLQSEPVFSTSVVSEKINIEDARCVLQSGSYYFGVCHPTRDFYRDEIANAWVLSTRSSVKNYSGEIERFLKWLKPYIQQGSGKREFYAIVTHEYGLPKIYYLKNSKRKAKVKK